MIRPVPASSVRREQRRRGGSAMKILMATMGLDIGGAETHIVELAKEL